VLSRRSHHSHPEATHWERNWLPFSFRAAGSLGVLDSAQSLAISQFVMTGKENVLGTKDHREVALASTSRDAAAHIVSVFTRRAFNRPRFHKLRVKSAFLTDCLGRPGTASKTASGPITLSRLWREGRS
jgi:hypothetical protein